MPQIAANRKAGRLLAAAGIVAVVPAAVLAPGAHGLSRWTIPFALTSVDVAGAEHYLYDAANGDPFGTAASNLDHAYEDSQAMFHQSSVELAALNWWFLTDSAGIGHLGAGALGDATQILDSSGQLQPVPAGIGTDGIDVTHDGTATQYFTGVINEANIVTSSLQNLQGLATAAAPGFPTELGVVSDLMLVQQDVNAALQTLDQSIPSLTPDDSNGLLNSALQGLLVSEINLNQMSADIPTELSLHDDVGLAQTDAAMISNALGEYLYTQGIIGFFSLENALGDIGGWFSSP